MCFPWTLFQLSLIAVEGFSRIFADLLKKMIDFFVLQWHTWLQNDLIEPGEVKGPFVTGSVHKFFFHTFTALVPADVRTLKETGCNQQSDHFLCHLKIFYILFPKEYLQVRCTDELDPLWHGLALNEMNGDALFHRLLHIASVACWTKLDVAVLCNQLHMIILAKDVTH